MPTRIIFNGQEYESQEAMPEDIRRAYQELLDKLEDKDRDGIPDILQRGHSGDAIGIVQTSVTYNGRTVEDLESLPAPVRHLLENVIGHRKSAGSAPTDPPGSQPLVQALNTAGRATEKLLRVFIAFVAGFVLIFSVGLMFAIGGGREHLAGRLTVATATFLLLGWLDTHATRLARRQQPLLGPDSGAYRRFVIWSASGLLLVTLLLFGLALFLP